jgi:hypothetical protein
MAVMNLAVAQDNLKDNLNLSVSDIKEMFELSLPFDSRLGISLKELEKTLQAPPGETVNEQQAAVWQFFQSYYGYKDAAAVTTAGSESNPEWRRIDSDWLESAGSLALYLDGDINNTSLVLAIELSEGGKVLLFPGDAQHGSWLTWASTPRGIDLLKRTIFYKVGHHGSNNATLVPSGLDQMTSPDLVAMIPVDPVRQPNFHMPNDALKSRLLTQARGRVIQACEGREAAETCPCVDFHLPAGKPSGMPATTWNRFIRSVDWDRSPDRLWVEYRIDL